MTLGRYIPVTDDRDTGGFFQALAQGKLVYRACNDCGKSIHPPTSHCPHCGSSSTRWQKAAGTGTLYSYTTVHHQVHPAYPTPYTIVLVELDGVTPAVRLVGELPGAPELTVGMKMRVRFDTIEGVPVAQWDPI